MITARIIVFILISTVAAGWISGCGQGGEQVLAVVGDYEITKQEFDEFYKVPYSFPTAQDEFNARLIALDSAITTRLLVQAAMERGIDTLEELARVVLANKNKFLTDVLYLRRIEEPAEPTEAEMKEFHKHLKDKVRASHILVDNLDTANMLLERIQQGESFERLAYTYSRDPSARRNRGDLGYFTWGTMVTEFQEAAYGMQPGEVSPPVKSRYGYHIIKVVDRLPNENWDEYDAMKESLREQVKRYKTTLVAEKYFEEIQDRYAVSVDTATCDYLLHKREQIYPPQLLETLPRNDFDPEQLDRNEKELVLATWDGGQITVSEYLTLANRSLARPARPDFDNYDSLATVIFRLKLNDIMVIEAHRQGIDNDPEYLRKLKLFKELAMAEIMKDDSLPQPPPPTETELKQYYDDNIEQFTIPAKVQVHEILLSDELRAQKLAKELNTFQEFKDAASRYTERSGKRIGGGNIGWIQKMWMPEHFEAAWNTPVGGIAGPVKVDDKFAVLYVVDKVDAEVKDFLAEKSNIMARLLEKQKEEALLEWVMERKKSTPVVVNEDALWSTVDMDKYASVDTTSASESDALP